MSQQNERAVTKEDLEAYLKRRIAELEEELRSLRSLLEYIEDAGKVSPTERVEEVKSGRRRIARLMIGEGYVRAVPDLPLGLPRELRDYLETVEGELRAYQSKLGQHEGEGARLSIRERPDGTVAEVRFDGLLSTLEVLKAKGALRYAMETAYEIYRAQAREERQEADEAEEGQDKAGEG